MKITNVIGLMLLAALTFGLAGKAAAGCNDLAILSSGPMPNKYNIACAHGKVDRIYGDRNTVLTNIGLYGPDCTITFTDTGWKGQSFRGTYRFQQNYCSTHSGRITVQHVSGHKINYTVHEGDWSEGRRGVVKLGDFIGK